MTPSRTCDIRATICDMTANAPGVQPGKLSGIGGGHTARPVIRDLAADAPGPRPGSLDPALLQFARNGEQQVPLLDHHSEPFLEA
jgi:hypothetical protein